MNLQLSLKRQWFEMTKSEEKKEDYREITNYWFKRLFGFYITDGETGFKSDDTTVYSVLSHNRELIVEKYPPKQFTTNTMTLGYPKKDDADRIIKFEHAGVEIRTGRPEWGAEEGKLYFVIKHGKRIQ